MRAATSMFVVFHVTGGHKFIRFTEPCPITIPAATPRLTYFSRSAIGPRGENAARRRGDSNRRDKVRILKKLAIASN
jgi:hypothetical protein